MRVAFVGKGGAGKSAIAGTFARVLARKGLPVLALDSDPLPGLAFSLGLDRSDHGIPDDAVVERAEGEEGPRFRLRPGLSGAEAVDLYAATAPDGVRFLQFGKPRGRQGEFFRSQHAFLQILKDLPHTDWNVVGDLPGGTRQAFYGWGDFAETILIVSEPTAKALLSARRLAKLSAREGTRNIVALASKVARDEPEQGEDVVMVGRRTGLEVVGWVPWDEELAAAERRGEAPIDGAPNSAAVAAVTALAERLVADSASQALG
ncbi:MAG: hypothetical protein ACRDYC_08825 [Acidimicrobiales bacterium]